MSALGGNLAFLMFVGAARADASPDQLAQLRERLPPLLDAYKAEGNPRPTMEAVIDIMGPTWRPQGDWARQIDTFLKGDD